MENNDDKETGLSNMLPYRLEIPFDNYNIDISQMADQKELKEIAQEAEGVLSEKFFDPDADDWETIGDSIFSPMANLMHGSTKVTTFMIELMRIRSIEPVEAPRQNELLMQAAVMRSNSNATDLNRKLLQAMQSFERGDKPVPALMPVRIDRNSVGLERFRIIKNHNHHMTTYTELEYDGDRILLEANNLKRFRHRLLRYEIIQPSVNKRKEYPAVFLPYADKESCSNYRHSDRFLRNALASLYVTPSSHNDFMAGESLVRMDCWMLDKDEYEFIYRKVPLVRNWHNAGKTTQEHIATLLVPYWCIAERLGRKEFKLYPFGNRYNYPIEKVAEWISAKDMEAVNRAVLEWEANKAKDPFNPRKFVRLRPLWHLYRMHCHPKRFRIGSKYLNEAGRDHDDGIRCRISDHAKQVLMADRKRHV